MRTPLCLKFVAALAGLLALAACSKPPENSALPPGNNPALTVSTVQPQTVQWAQTLAASGNIVAWQEAIIGAEIGGFRITEVLANVGDFVQKGQVLARISNDALSNELAEAKAAVAESEATFAEAQANLERSNRLREKGFYSAQQNTREQTAAESALARLNAAKARYQSAQLRHSKSNVIAPDAGIISARIATVGSLSEHGKELFRLIRGGRLEWRAEVTADERHRVQTGQTALIHLFNENPIRGTVRIVAPTVDPQTRTGLVYVDLPKGSVDAAQKVGAGMFARGELILGETPAMTLPQSAVLLREGFAYVFKLDAPVHGSGQALFKVAQVKVETGRRQGNLIEIKGLDPNTQVVDTGAGFLTDGDTVKLSATAK